MRNRGGSEPKLRPAAKPRYRRDVRPAWLSAGYRPFFLLAGFWALVVLPLSVAVIQGIASLPIVFDPVRWHFHEMVFGYIAAVVAGFLLTAIPNWTGRLPLQGWRLLVLVLLWFAGRLAVSTSDAIGALPAAALDCLFLLALILAALREILAGANWRNLPVVAVLALLLLSNLLFHAVSLDLMTDDGTDARAALASMVILISLIGGRIVPSFTRNWLVKHEARSLPASFGPFDRLTLAATLVALLLWVVLAETVYCGVTTAIAAALNFARLLRWRGHLTAREPLLWILHLGYLWIPLGLALVSLSALFPAVPVSAGIHALTAGAMGTMTLAVMSRATLGHSGSDLRAGPGLTAMFCLVTLAAAGRVLAALLPAFALPFLYGSAAAWIGAFALFLWTCGPILRSRDSTRVESAPARAPARPPE